MAVPQRRRGHTGTGTRQAVTAMRRVAISITAALALASTAGCGSSETAGPGGSTSSAGASAAGGSGSGGGSGGSPSAADPKTCVPGIPATSQIPRLKNAEYDAVVRDLLGVTTLASASNAAPSSLLVPDFDGSLTDIAWNGYLVAAERIAAEVMAGPARSRFITCQPGEGTCLTDTIKSFGRKAFRRPLTDTEVASFERLAKLTPSGTPDEVAEAVLFALLASPSFLTRAELQQEQEGAAFKLSSHEVASRLSFLLWGSLPDEALSAAADAGQLASREQIRAQAERMVQVREKTGPVVRAFHRFYADIYEGSHWGALDHDTTVFPKYSPQVRQPMLAELDAFFEEVAFTSGSFAELLLSDVGFVTRATAPLYGLDAASYGDEPTRVTFPAGERPGFLTRIGFLGSFSSHSTTSPILRGAFITGHVLGQEVGAPPPGATDTPIPPGDYTTQRQLVNALTSPPSCAGCHGTFINPPGFVLERFDAVGDLQTQDPLGGPIEASAEVYFGSGNVKTISTPLELMTELARTPGAARHYAERWVAYATGRTPNGNDACAVEQLSGRLVTGDLGIVDLMVELTLTDSFRLRTVAN